LLDQAARDSILHSKEGTPLKIFDTVEGSRLASIEQKKGTGTAGVRSFRSAPGERFAKITALTAMRGVTSPTITLDRVPTAGMKTASLEFVIATNFCVLRSPFGTAGIRSSRNDYLV
jgi:hypothetical protein